MRTFNLKKITFSWALAVSILFGFAPSAWAELEPYRVTKSGDILVPDGMKLFTDSTGNRWVLPVEMDSAPEQEIKINYYKNKNTPSVIGHIGSQEILDSPLSSLDTIISVDASEKNNLMRKVSPTLAMVMNLEKAANKHAKSSADLQSLGLFAPDKFTTFKIPYIPIPESDFEFAKISDYASKITKKHLSFIKDGVKYHRFFIHPNYVDSYSELIAKHGIVYHYEALSTSSPRSLIVLDPDFPKEVLWIKPSLHRKIDGSVRINTDKKARRAIIMSEAINEVPKEALKNYGVRFMLEPAAFQPKGKISSTIVREVAPELLEFRPDVRWVPAFIFQNTGADAVPGLNIQEMIAQSGMEPESFVREKLVSPLLKAYLSLGLIEGLPGELHTQNFYYETKKNAEGHWILTGEVLFKDNDGFRYDTELALRQKRGMKFFSQFNEPFVWGKFSNTVGLGSEGVPFIGSWYYKLIRNVNGFQTLAAYALRALETVDSKNNWNKDKIQRLFDDTAAREVLKITGVHIDPNEYGFGYNLGINKALNKWREKLSLAADQRQITDMVLQQALYGEWIRLKEAGRTSSLRRGFSQRSKFLLHLAPDGALIIEARTESTAKNPDPTVGFAILEDSGTLEGKRSRKVLMALADKYLITSCKSIFN